ncbi:MAG TPA: YhfC family glutamic-type intramembrane protease, partial [Clostridia bacterium]|nr:YhfC family glutamic-type intramembrane protease [Clostridia bacterium]
FAYGAFAGMMAGLFEETGRYSGFAVLLRKKRGKDINGLMYGAGHGGIEAVLVMSLAMVSNLVFAFSVNAGTADPSMASIAAQLAGIAPVTFLVSIVERIGAVALHISLSVLVWFAVKNRKRFWLFPLAIVLHALVDAVAVIMSRFVTNIWLIEAAVYLLAGVCAVLAVIVYKRNSKPAEMAADPAVDIA